MSHEEMASIQSYKQTMRLTMKKILANIPNDAVLSQSRAVFTALKAFQPYVNSSSISIYLSMPGGEIQTDEIVRDALQRGKHVFIPYLHKPSEPIPEGPVRVMDMVRLRDIEDYQSLARDKWGIPSVDPSTVDQRDRILGDAKTTDATERVVPTLDLMLMPGVVFDTEFDTGHIRRLGHGKGFYDYFINRYNCAKNASDSPPLMLYGLALKEQYIGSSDSGGVPVGPHDKYLDGVICGDGSVWKASFGGSG